MPELPPLSPFHQEIISHVLATIERHIPEGKFQISKEDPFSSLLASYHALLNKPSPCLEKDMLSTFSSKKMLRGLPRLYKRENPGFSRIKKEFSHTPTLKRMEEEKALLATFDRVSVPSGAKITLFTYVLPDGWGDLIAAKESEKILQAKFPSLQIQMIVCLPKTFSLQEAELPSNALVIRYEKACPVSLFPDAAIEQLEQSSFVISLPTFYPEMEELQRKIGNKKVISIGQYGFIESSWFHPQSGNYSMGLHFLEQGVFTRAFQKAGDFTQLQNIELLQSLFHTANPTLAQIEKYLTLHRLYFAYLLSKEGGAIYLHALLGANISSDQTIDICSPSLHWLIAYIEAQEKQNRPILEGEFNVRAIEIHFDGRVYTKQIQNEGKTVRIIAPNALSDHDFRLLIRLSGEFVAVRGDQSFSEAVSANKVFFYDGAPHARYFMKDMIALAENRLRAYPGALEFFRCMGKSFLYNIPEETGEWVEETYFQEKEPWTKIAHALGDSLHDPSTLSGFSLFNRIIAKEYSFNKTLCRFVQREFANYQDSIE